MAAELEPGTFTKLYGVAGKNSAEAQWSPEGGFTDEHNQELGLHITSLREQIAEWAGNNQRDFQRILSGKRTPNGELQTLLSDLATSADSLALGNRFLIDYVLNSSAYAPSVTPQDREDLQQEGWGGLLHAALNYNPNHEGSENKFSTYAVPSIQGFILRGLSTLDTIRLPQYATGEYYDYQKIRATLWIFLEREPTHTDVTYIMYLTSTLGRAPTEKDVNTFRKQIDPSSWQHDNAVHKKFVHYAKRIMAVVRAKKQVVSLDDPQRRSWRNGEGELEEIGGEIGDEWASALTSDLELPEDHGFYITLKKDLKKAMEVLTQEEYDVLALRFGLHDGKDWTLDEIAQQHHRTFEHVRMIEAGALRKLRHPSRSINLRDYLK